MSFVSELEEDVDTVVEWGTRIVEEAVQALSDKGRPFEYEPKSNADKLEEYTTTLRGNPEAWFMWIDQRAQEIIGRLMKANLAPELIASVHPYDIAYFMAHKYSAEMESKLLTDVESLIDTEPTGGIR